MDQKNYKKLPFSSASQPFILVLPVRQHIEQINSSWIASGTGSSWAGDIFFFGHAIGRSHEPLQSSPQFHTLALVRSILMLTFYLCPCLPEQNI
jgi:hypothetical protein